mgnify:CR=1 FL=1
MSKVYRVIVVLCCFVGIGLISFFHHKEIKRSGSYDLSVLSENVEVRFDEYGIPHISGDKIEDVYRVHGFIVAGERLFQMDLLRRLVQGRLSEVFGDKTLDADKMLRQILIKKTADKIVASDAFKNDQQMTMKMKAFLEGIHYYIDNQPLPVEFNLLNYRPERFTLSDIVGVTGYMALTFSEGIKADVFISEMRDKLPDEKLALLRVGADADKDYFPSQKIVKSDVLNNIHKSIEQVTGVLPLFHGSNSWVLSGDRTVSGKPILANDPHIGAGNPHIFYEAHLKSRNFELYGNFIPLVPFAIMGHTPHSAWGITMAMVDDVNVYAEKLDPQNPDVVMFNNEWVPLGRTREKIKVKDGDDVYIDITETSHGPIIDGSKYGAEGKTLSLSWSYYHPRNLAIKSLHELPMAETVPEFKQALSHAAAPPLNVTWVNKQGDIAWWVLGKFPKLADGVPSDIILSGWDGSHEVERYYDFEENPHVVNPDSGVIVSANYQPQQLEFAHFDGYWQPAGRYFRLEELLGKKTKWDLESLKEVQTDNIVPIISKLKIQLSQGIVKSELTSLELEAYLAFESWDGNTDRSSVSSSIYHMWLYYITRNAFLDELGKDGFKTFGKLADFWHAMKKLLFSLDHSFWDDVSTNRVESGRDIIYLSFKQAVDELDNRFGNRINTWEWGKLHRAVYEHPLGKVKPLDLIYNIGPVPADGGRYVINNLAHRKDTNNFTIVHGPATRRLIDMNDPLHSFGIMPIGNSGNPFSDHFDDQLDLYHSGKYRLQNMDWSLIRQYPLLEFRAE